MENTNMNNNAFCELEETELMTLTGGSKADDTMAYMAGVIAAPVGLPGAAVVALVAYSGNT